MQGQQAQSANIGSENDEDGNSETSSDEEDDDEGGVQATQGYNPADYANLQVLLLFARACLQSGFVGDNKSRGLKCSELIEG